MNSVPVSPWIPGSIPFTFLMYWESGTDEKKIFAYNCICFSGFGETMGLAIQNLRCLCEVHDKK